MIPHLDHFGMVADGFLLQVENRFHGWRRLRQRTLQKYILRLDVRVDDSAVVEKGDSR